jgi:hypothetical protein
MHLQQACVSCAHWHGRAHIARRECALPTPEKMRHRIPQKPRHLITQVTLCKTETLIYEMSF